MNIQKLGWTLNYAAHQQKRYLKHHLAPLNMGPRTLPYYLTIAHNEGISQKEILECLFTDKTRTTKAINYLEKVGFVERKCSAEDNRVKGVFLTDEGLGILPEIQKVLQKMDCLLSDEHSEKDIERFISMLDAFGAAVRKDIGEKK